MILIKVLGIILGVIVGILLLLALLILLVPVRYRMFGRAQKDIEFHVKAGWLFRFLYFTACYENGVMALEFRVLGIVVKNNQEPDKKKATKKVKERKIKKKQKDKNNREEQPSQIDTHFPKSKGARQEVKKKDYEIEEKEEPSFSKLEQWIHNITTFFGKMKTFVENISNKFKDFNAFFTNTKDKVSGILDFLGDEGNKKGIEQIWLSIKKVLNHSFPKKIQGEILFGTGDPCSTGQALGFLSLIYSFCGESLIITPDFENKVFRGELKGRGRIRLVTLLIICIKLLYNDNFIQFRKNYKELKEVI